MPPVRVWVGCATWVWLGAWGAVLRRCVFPAWCSCGGYAAGTRLGWLCPWVLAGCLACVSRGRVCPAGCSCGGCAAGARLGGCAAWIWVGCLAAWMCCGYAGHRRSFSPYKQSPPLRGGCRRQPAGGGMVYALIPPASLIPGRSGSCVSACAVRHDLRPAALQLFTTAPSVSEYFALYLQYDCTAARQRYAAKTAAAANSGWEVWAWPYLQRGGPVTVRPTE